MNWKKSWKILSLVGIFCGGTILSSVSSAEGGDPLTAILKAVRDTSSDGVAKLVKQASLNDDFRWKALFNGQDGELPLLDSFVGGYLKKFISIFMDQETLQQAQQLELSNYQSEMQHLVSGNLQFNMNASAASVCKADQQLLKEAKKLNSNFNAVKLLNLATNLSPASVSAASSVYYPSMEDIIGTERYNSDQQKKAALFIRSLLSGASVMGDVVSEYNAKNHVLTVYVPSSTETHGYRTISISDIKEKDVEEFKKKLSTQANYQSFKTKQNAVNAIRSIYTDNLIRAYAARQANIKVKKELKSSSNFNDYAKDETKSLAEIESEAARLTLDGKYLERLKNGTLADFRIEELAMLNRIVYFLNKLHQDYERLSFALAATAIQLTAADSSMDNTYYKPIGTWIENQCWKDGNSNKEQCINPSSSTEATAGITGL